MKTRYKLLISIVVVTLFLFGFYLVQAEEYARLREHPLLMPILKPLKWFYNGFFWGLPIVWSSNRPATDAPIVIAEYVSTMDTRELMVGFIGWVAFISTIPRTVAAIVNGFRKKKKPQAADTPVSTQQT